MKQLTIGLCLSLLILGCAKSEQNKQAAEQPPANKQPAAEKTDQVKDKPPPVGLQDSITISRETTRIMEPLDDAGYVNYLQALNDRAAQGTTVQNNFEVVVRQVMTPEIIPEELRSEYFRLLGIPVPDQGARFYRGFVDFTLKGNTDRQQEETLLDEQDRIMAKPWKASEHPAASKWLVAQEKHLDQLAAGSRREKFYTPYLASALDEDGPFLSVVSVHMPSVQQQRNVARGLTIRAQGRIATGDLDNAWNDLQAMHRMARHIGSGVTIIESLVGIAVDSMAFQAEIHILKSPALTADQCQRFFADLKSLPSLPPLTDRIDIGERFMGLDAVTALARYVQGKDYLEAMNELFKTLKLMGALSDAAPASDSVTLVAFQEDASKQESKQASGPIDWNAALQVLNGWYDKLVAANRLVDSQQRQAQLKKIEQELQQLATDATNPARQLTAMVRDGSQKMLGKAIGNILVAMLLPAPIAVGRAEDGATARRAVLQIGFALNLHARETGMLPGSLVELAPRYLESIPKDPLSGAPLKYTVKDKSFLLYSVGRNGVDDQGQTRDDAEQEQVAIQPEWDDITVRVGR
ncbi:MAG: hypothetical protein VB877_20675 [Pirellulaceae bacterium]